MSSAASSSFGVEDEDDHTVLCFQTSSWNPTPSEWEQLLYFIESDEKERIGRLRMHEDAKRSLMGLVLSKYALSTALHRPISSIQLSRTKNNKPYLVHNPAHHIKQGLNFNISHSGDWVVVSISQKHLIGVDINDVAVTGGSSVSLDSFFSDLTFCFVPNEWNYILRGNHQSSSPSPICSVTPSAGAFPLKYHDKTPYIEPQSHLQKALTRSRAETYEGMCQLRRFFVLWTLKEAYMKAVGQGFGIEPASLEFTIPCGTCSQCTLQAALSASTTPSTNSEWVLGRCVRLQRKNIGELSPIWRFGTRMLDSEHMISIALGPHDQESIPVSAAAAAALSSPSDSIEQQLNIRELMKQGVGKDLDFGCLLKLDWSDIKSVLLQKG